MGIQPDVSPYGGQTVTGPGWPNVDEDVLGAAAAQYEALAAKISGTVVPQQQGQLMKMSGDWLGPSSVAAAGEASTIIGGHESNAAQAAAIAAKLRTMEATVIQTKTMANIVAQETQAECMAIQSMPVSNTQALVQSRIMLGLSQNSATVSANATTMANAIGAPPSLPTTGAPAVGPQQAAGMAGQDPGQAMQMMGQLAGLVGQLPQMLGQAMGQVTQAPQQLMQSVGQPLQQLTSMFGGGSGGGMGAGGLSPFSAFSNHPLAGGSGAAAGAGMVRAAGLPGGGGGSAQSPLMASLVGNTLPVSVAPAPGAGAGGGAVGGMAPVGAGGGMGGGMGPMMGQRGTSGGTTTGLALPEALEHDLAEDDVDEDW
ncbi:hypothetical protein L2K20_12835 [Mycobacterium sp. MBM]|nr:hypothetical protein [Mycobacterium sp. MBM]